MTEFVSRTDSYAKSLEATVPEVTPELHAKLKAAIRRQ